MAELVVFWVMAGEWGETISLATWSHPDSSEPATKYRNIDIENMWKLAIQIPNIETLPRLMLYRVH